MLLKNKKRDVDPPPKIVGEEDKHLFYLIIIQKAMKYNTTNSN